MYKKTKCNRKYTFENMIKRVKEANTEEELDLVSDLVDQLADADMISAYQHKDLDYQLDQRLCDLVLENKI